MDGELFDEVPELFGVVSVVVVPWLSEELGVWSSVVVVSVESSTVWVDVELPDEVSVVSGVVVPADSDELGV